MNSTKLSPLEKLYSLQDLDVMDHFVLYPEFYKKDGKQMVLTKDEMIPIISFVIIEARVPDLATQFELITAFSSEYMQEA